VLTIDCRDVESIKKELLVYVSDQIGAIPTIKIHEFVLSPINEGETIDKTEVITAIKEFLNSIGEGSNFAVISKEEIVLIKSIYGKKIQSKPQPQTSLFSCSHCGFVTQYEVEYNNHVKIHYL